MGVKIYGTTLWTDFNKNDPLAKMAAYNLNDYNYIRYNKKIITPEIVYEIHKKELELLTKFINENKEDKKIIISHHVPSYTLLDPYFKGDVLNHCFASSLEHLTLGSNINFWISGHSHFAIDKEIGKTKFIINPYGYEHEVISKGYTDKKLIRIS